MIEIPLQKPPAEGIEEEQNDRIVLLVQIVPRTERNAFAVVVRQDLTHTTAERNPALAALLQGSYFFSRLASRVSSEPTVIIISFVQGL